MECPEEAHAYIGRTCKLRTDRPRLSLNSAADPHNTEYKAGQEKGLIYVYLLPNLKKGSSPQKNSYGIATQIVNTTRSQNSQSKLGHHYRMEPNKQQTDLAILLAMIRVL